MLAEKQPAGVGAHATAAPGVTERAHRGCRCRDAGHVGKDTVTELAEQPNHFVVSNLGLEDHLKYEVRSLIEGIVRSGVEGSAAGAGIAKDKVAEVAMRRQRGLRILDRKSTRLNS